MCLLNITTSMDVQFTRVRQPSLLSAKQQYVSM